MEVGERYWHILNAPGGEVDPCCWKAVKQIRPTPSTRDVSRYMLVAHHESMCCPPMDLYDYHAYYKGIRRLYTNGMPYCKTKGRV